VKIKYEKKYSREELLKAMQSYSAWRFIISFFCMLFWDFIGFIRDLAVSITKWLRKPLKP
jgi:hypothetical protein